MVRSNGPEWSILIEGHAGSGPYGHDLVCACISLLTTMIAQTLMDEKNVITRLCTMESGKAEFKFNIYNCMGIKRSLNTIITGFELLSQEYPQYLVLFKELKI